MGRTSTNPRKCIVSCRVSHKELEALHERAKESGLSITTLMRMCLNLSEKEFGGATQASA